MLGLRFISGTVAWALMASGALACEPLPYNPGWKDEPIGVAPSCAFDQAGEIEGREIVGSPAKSLDNGLVYQVVSEFGFCRVSETLLVVDCQETLALQVAGVASENAEDFGAGPDTLVENLLRPKGAIKLNKRTTLDQLTKTAARKSYTHTSDISASLSKMKPHNRYDPFCGCKLHYPDSKGASQ